MSERQYIAGEKSAWRTILREAIKHLGYAEDLEAQKAAWILEREGAIATLRLACDEHGDNNWDDKLHLSDIIDKHLIRPIERAIEDAQVDRAEEREQREAREDREND